MERRVGVEHRNKYQQGGQNSHQKWAKKKGNNNNNVNYSGKDRPFQSYKKQGGQGPSKSNSRPRPRPRPADAKGLYKQKSQPEVSDRDKAIIRQYQKSQKPVRKDHQLKDNLPKMVQLDKFSALDKNKDLDDGSKSNKKNFRKPSKLQSAKDSYQNRINERKKQIEEQKVRNQERVKAQVQRKKDRKEKFKFISQKTPSGQPVMKGRIEYLLKKIQGQGG